MVLINGVKYACERCIRGHRVTTCTHTDQPLTMIKPKGRPATQCQHCREQRKNKHFHTLCTCGKKGKSPGMHLALCQCHKSSHCTCASNASKKGSDTKKKLEKSVSELNIRKEAGGSGIFGGAVGNVGSGMGGVGEVSGFEMGNGLFDMFSPSSDNFSSALVTEGVGNGLQNGSGAAERMSVSTTGSGESQPGFGLNSTNNHALANNGNTENIPESDEGNMVDNMFPLFPLVGSSSFSDNKNQPLSPLPDHFKGKLDQNVASSLNKSYESNENFNPAISHYQQIRPKRPESSLSVASNSSTGSRPNSNMDHLNYQNISSAYPPNSLNFSEDGVDQNGDQFNSDSLFNDQYETRHDQYEQFINSINHQDKTDNNDSNLGLDKKGNQSSRSMDLELHPMFSELLLPMKYDSQQEK